MVAQQRRDAQHDESGKPHCHRGGGGLHRALDDHIEHQLGTRVACAVDEDEEGEPARVRAQQARRRDVAWVRARVRVRVRVRSKHADVM
jgi:hypothetical protein|tara:strand:+ start:190 stop:456 length:267 start_codon:yes stop_codon:yes gene_type:complete